MKQGQRFERVRPAFVLLNSALSATILGLFLALTLVDSSNVALQQRIALAGSIVLAVVYCGVGIGFLIYSTALARQIQQVLLRARLSTANLDCVTLCEQTAKDARTSAGTLAKRLYVIGAVVSLCMA